MSFHKSNCSAFILSGASSLSFVSFGLSSSDSQLWPIFAIALAIPLVDSRINVQRNMSLFVAFTSIGIVVNTLINYSSIDAALRFIVSLLIFVLSSVVTTHLIVNNIRICPPLKFFNLTAVSFAFLQFINPSFIGLLSVNRAVLGHSIYSRGFPSFFPEPSIFGFYLLICSIIYFYSANFKFSQCQKIIILNFLATVLLSQSTLVILLFCSFILSIFIDPLLESFCRLRLNIRMLIPILFIAFLGLLLAIFVILNFSNSSRVGNLLSLIFSNPFSLFMIDASSNYRLFHVITPFILSFDNVFLPFSFDGMNLIHDFKLPAFIETFFWYKTGGKTMNFLGEIVLSLGIFGVMAIFFVAKAPFAYLIKRRKYALTLILFLMLVNAIPLAFPAVGLLFGILSVPLESSRLSIR